MTDWLKILKDYQSTPQYDKSLTIVVNLNIFRNYYHIILDNKIKKDLNLSSRKFDSILAGDDQIPVSVYNQILRYQVNYAKKHHLN